MGQGTLLRKLTRRNVTLEAATKAARASGEIAPTDVVEVTIRKVTAMEITKLTGLPPALLRQAATRQVDESDEAWKQRYKAAIEEDGELRDRAVDYTINLTRAVLVCGVVDPQLKLEPSDPLDLTPEDLGRDSTAVYNAIVEFSDLPIRLVEGVGDSAKFPAGQGSGGAESDGALLRHDTEPTPETEPG